MAKLSAKGAIILIDDSAGSPQNVSKDAVSYSVELSVDQPEVTGFTEGVHNFVPGMLLGPITIDFLWNTTATTGATTVLRGILQSATSKTLSIQPEGSGIAWSGEYMLVSYGPKGTPSGAIQLGSAKFVPMGAVAGAWA